MKKCNVDLVVGGSILLALFILIAGVLWLKESSVSRRMVSYTAIFDNVGTLQQGDPVMVNGVKKGSVSRIGLRGIDVAVVLSIDKGVTLTDSSTITVQNIGLMGERGVGIQLKTSGNEIKPNSKTDTLFIAGKFDTGIAEAMGMLGTVLTEVELLAQSVTAIIENTIGDTTFLTFFDTMVERLDTLTGMTERLVKRNEPLINRSVANISQVTTDLKSLLDRNSNSIDGILSKSDLLTSQALTVMAQVDTLTESHQLIVGKVERGEGALGQLIQDEQFYPDLKQTLASIDTLVNEVQSDALKLRVRLGFGRRKN